MQDLLPLPTSDFRLRLTTRGPRVRADRCAQHWFVDVVNRNLFIRGRKIRGIRRSFKNNLSRNKARRVEGKVFPAREDAIMPQQRREPRNTRNENDFQSGMHHLT